MEQAHPGNGEEWPAAHVHSFKPSLEMRVEEEGEGGDGGALGAGDDVWTFYHFIHGKFM